MKSLDAKGVRKGCVEDVTQGTEYKHRKETSLGWYRPDKGSFGPLHKDSTSRLLRSDMKQCSEELG